MKILLPAVATLLATGSFEAADLVDGAAPASGYAQAFQCSGRSGRRHGAP
jgi:hypothetical protein